VNKKIMTLYQNKSVENHSKNKYKKYMGSTLCSCMPSSSVLQFQSNIKKQDLPANQPNNDPGSWI